MIYIFFILTFFSSCFAVGPIQIIGQTKPSKFIVAQISSEDYAQTLIAVMTALDNQLTKNLNTPVAKKSDWRLQKISLGLGETGEIGIGPYKFGTALKQRFVFGRQ